MNRLAKNSIAAGLTTLLVTTGLSFSAYGADPTGPIVAKSNSSAVTSTGLGSPLDSDSCEAATTGDPADATPAGICGDGLSTSGVNAFSQNASAGLDGKDGTSAADASVAPINIDALTTIDISTAADDVAAIETGTILDGLGTVGDLLGLLLNPVLDAVQEALVGPLTTQLQEALPVALQVGAVSSECTVTAGSDPTGDSTVAATNILITLGPDNVITVPITAATSDNAALVGSVAPQQLINGILDGLRVTLAESFGGIADPLNVITDALQDQIINEVLDVVGPALLDPLGEALTPILTGTVNQQETLDDGSFEVTALSLDVLGTAITLDLGRSNCGPNSTLVVDNDDNNADADADANADANADADADANADANTDANADANADATPVASIADADSAADADVQASLPNAGAPNLLPFFLLGIALLAFGLAVLLNERRRLGLPSSDNVA